MRSRRFKTLLAFISIALINIDQSFAQNEKHHNELTSEMVINSSSIHYPQILSYYEKVKASEGQSLAARGVFDIKLKQEYTDKSRGFFDGKTYDLTLEKELGALGSKVFGGYRKSYGNFPIYEGGSLTNSGGEYRFGGKLSLLRGRDIDENRLGVILADLSLKESKIQLEKIKVEIERDATQAYWKWFAAGKVYQIYRELYQLSLTRQSQLEQRLKRGDVAQIIVDENRKNILRRKTSMIKAEQDFDNSAIYLSLFWRNDEGKPQVPHKDQLPKLDAKPHEIAHSQIEKDVEIALNNRPEIRILKIKKEEELSQLKYSKNLYQPELDVEAGASKDLGQGSATRQQGENYLKLNFAIPLQQREAEGKTLKAESMLSFLKFEQKITEEKISAEIEQIRVRVKNIVEMYKNLNEEVELAKLLEEAEREKFRHGASNFFLVNMRESDTAMSRAIAMEMYEKYQEAIADYNAAIFAREKTVKN